MTLNIESAIRSIVKIRVTEEMVAKSFFDQKIFSFLHLMVGQEASPAGIAGALHKTDVMVGNHRSHGHYMAKGGDYKKMIYEIFGDQRGCCLGYGGSMHMLDRSVGFDGSTPILGSVSCIGVGKAFADKISNISRVTVAFVGDGAAEEGVFMESVNLACNKECPIIFVIEDNKYAVNSNFLDRKSSGYSHESLFSGLGASYMRIDGQNVAEVHAATSKAREMALKGKPVVMHIDLLRTHGHSGPMKENDTAPYRDQNDTLEDRNSRDCIRIAVHHATENMGYNLSEVNMWIENESAITTQNFNDIVGGINVRG